MPKIRDWTFGYNTATGTTVTAALPSYQQNDLLLAILTADTGAQVWSSTGWAQLFSATNTSNVGILWKIATASEAQPTFTYSLTETANVHILTIQDINTTTPFNGTGGAGTGYITAANALARAAMPVLTTTVANSLILYVNSESGVVVPGVLEGPCTFEDASDGAAHSDGFSWGFKKAAGATPTVYGNKSGVAAGVLATIGISAPAAGASSIPTYCASDASLYIDPIHGVTAYNGNVAFAATAVANFGATINGRTLANGVAAAAADVGINSFHSMGQLTGVVTDGTYAGAALVLAAANKPSVAGKNILVHCKPSTPKSYQNTDPITKATSKGIVFAMASTAATAFKAWHVHGAGTPWNSSSHVPIIINSTATAGLIQSTGTLVDTSIESFGFFASGFTVAPIFQFGSLWVLDTTIIAGGNSVEPVGINGIWKVCASGKERMSVLQQGAGQALVLQPIQFGNGGTDSIYLDLRETAIEFPQQYNVGSKNVFYCSADNVAGLTYYAGAGDTIIHNNAVVTSKSKFHWRIHASSSASATYNFSGLAIIGAGDIQLRAVTTFRSVSFTSCPSITQNSAVMDACIFTGSSITSTDLSIIDNSTFTSSGTGHAIVLTSLGSGAMGWTNTTIGYAATNGVTGNEGIYVNVASGTLTITVATGASVPTIRTSGAVVTVLSGQVTTTITVKDVNTGAVLVGARVYLEAGAGGSLVAGTIIFNTLTDASGQVSDTRSLASNQPVTGRVRFSTSPNFYKTTSISETISNTIGLSLNVSLIPDV